MANNTLLLFYRFFSINIVARFRLYYKPYTAENQSHCQCLLPCEHAHSGCQTHRYSHYGLHIIVNAYYRRAQCLLCCLHEQISHVCSEEHYECRACPRSGRDEAPVGLHSVRKHKWRKQHCCPCEHPFANGDGQ